MAIIRVIIRFFDYLVGMIWGVTTIEFIPYMYSNKFQLKSANQYFNTIFVIVGLIYAVIRLRHYYLNSELDRDIKEQQLKKIKKGDQEKLDENK